MSAVAVPDLVGDQELVVDVPYRRGTKAPVVGSQVGIVLDPRQIAVLR
jgi:hypothetical protein